MRRPACSARIALQLMGWLLWPITWPADRTQVLDATRQRKHAFFALRTSDDLKADGQTARVESAGHRSHRKPGQTEHEGRRDPVHIGVHLSSRDGVGIVLLNRKWRHRHARREQMVV